MVVSDCLSASVARTYLAEAMDNAIPRFNDDKRRRFVSIHKAFLKAIRLAKDAGQ